ncbi:hypothetical protein ACFYZ9_35520 [Streptomyces sp. NPDC001691]|uniref:hypothetical protein n=1 Tax=Streptomyces sp. NPDC001691 TaxID=3364600 RepID=UPI0036BCCB9C
MKTQDTHAAQPASEVGHAAVAEWLAASLHRPGSAYRQWADCLLASLALGRRFSAVRLTDHMVYAAAGKPSAVGAFLRILAGPVIHAPHSRAFYALVPPSSPGPDLGRHATYLGLGHYIGVPRVGDDRPDRLASYWLVPMCAPGVLCNPVRVGELVEAGTAALAEQDDW